MSFLRKTANAAVALVAVGFAFALIALLFAIAASALLVIAGGTLAIAIDSPKMLPVWFVCIAVGGLLVWLTLRCGRPPSFEKLQKKGLIETHEFKAKRAFGIEEDFDPGRGYFIELTGGGVLFLQGPYLYEFEEIDDDPELTGPRRFPCSRFFVHRHRTKRYVVKMEPLGDVIEPEGTAPYFSQNDFKKGRVPDDGDIIRDRTYDELKAERFGVSQ